MTIITNISTPNLSLLVTFSWCLAFRFIAPFSLVPGSLLTSPCNLSQKYYQSIVLHCIAMTATHSQLPVTLLFCVFCSLLPDSPLPGCLTPFPVLFLLFLANCSLFPCSLLLCSGSLLSAPCSLLHTYFSFLPAPRSLLPCSLLPFSAPLFFSPRSLLQCSLLHAPYSKCHKLTDTCLHKFRWICANCLDLYVQTGNFVLLTPFYFWQLLIFMRCTFCLFF